MCMQSRDLADFVLLVTIKRHVSNLWHFDAMIKSNDKQISESI